MLSRFHLMPERYGQTDIIAISISRVSVLNIRNKSYDSFEKLIICIDKDVKPVFNVHHLTVGCDAPSCTVIPHHRLNSVTPNQRQSDRTNVSC